MNTAFLLLAQYNGQSVIPIETVCKDYFADIRPDVFLRKVGAGDIVIPVVRMEADNQKCAKGVHVADLAKYIDDRRAAAIKECKQLNG